MGYREIMAEMDKRRAEAQAYLAASSTDSWSQLLQQQAPRLIEGMPASDRERIDEVSPVDIYLALPGIREADARLAHWNCAECPARTAKAYPPDQHDESGVPTFREDELRHVAARACRFPRLVLDGHSLEVEHGPCADTRIRLWEQELLHHMAAAGVKRKFWAARYADFDRSTPARKAASEAARAFTEAVIHGEEDVAGVALTGAVGVGKSFLAAAMVRHLVGRGVSVACACVPGALEARRRAIGQPDGGRAARLWERLEGATVAIFDDLGSERPTGAAVEWLFATINVRYEANRPLVLTSNCDLSGLAERLGDRIASRLAEMVVFYQVDGPDRRVQAARSRLAGLEG